MHFAAIDFETANYRSDSPCQVAVVVVEDGRRVIERSWLIRPRNLFFSDRCIAVHGIRPRDVLDQPEWDSVWSELSPLVEGVTLIAHNAMFDMAVLSSTLTAYDLVCPSIDFQCTRLIARRCWPGRTGYGLKPTAEALGISFRHHDALEDARACAEIALAAAKTWEAHSVESLEQQLSIQRGRLEYGNRIGPRCIRRGKTLDAGTQTRTGKSSRPSPTLHAKILLDGCKGILPLENRRVYLTGALMGLSETQSIEFLKNLGGEIEPALSATTDFWVMGTIDEEVSKEPFRDRDMQTVNSEHPPSISTGSTLIISQRQLLAMIPGGLSAARAFM